MEDKYNIECLINEEICIAELLVKEENEIYQIFFKAKSYNITAEGDNYFYALIELRKKLEIHNIKLYCKGCSKYVYPSPMIISMGDAIEAYELKMGKQAFMKDLVNIFESCKYEEYASIKEQYEYYIEWLKS